MKQIFAILLFLACSSDTRDKKNADPMPPNPSPKKYTYLALGDSYTIGERVAAPDNFPSQAVSLLGKEGLDIEFPRIIAKTGWATDELESGIVAANALQPLLPSYDLVSLLIGVNNQYRGETVENYIHGFEELLKTAIRYAGGRSSHVIVISIPDWGVTPFANGMDRHRIAGEIDAYNAANKKIALHYKVHYIDITAWTREAANDLSLLATDGLHPSAKEYKRWAEKITAFFRQMTE
jgi:lysophospholipase L1-like esterase